MIDLGTQTRPTFVSYSGDISYFEARHLEKYRKFPSFAESSHFWQIYQWETRLNRQQIQVTGLLLHVSSCMTMLVFHRRGQQQGAKEVHQR